MPPSARNPARPKAPSKRPPARAERLEARITSADKALFEQAAELEGVSVSEFAVTILRRESARTVAQVRALEYSRRDQAGLVDALFDTPPVASRLKRAARHHRRLFESK